MSRSRIGWGLPSLLPFLSLFTCCFFHAYECNVRNVHLKCCRKRREKEQERRGRRKEETGRTTPSMDTVLLLSSSREKSESINGALTLITEYFSCPSQQREEGERIQFWPGCTGVRRHWLRPPNNSLFCQFFFSLRSDNFIINSINCC